MMVQIRPQHFRVTVKKMENLNSQTLLNIALAILSAYLAVRNFLLTSKKDVQRESEEMTEIRVQLSQVMRLLEDMQKDIRASNADYRALSERVVRIEEKMAVVTSNLEVLKKEKGYE